MAHSGQSTEGEAIFDVDTHVADVGQRRLHGAGIPAPSGAAGDAELGRVAAA